MIPASNKRHHCWDLFLFPLPLLRPHTLPLSTYWAEEPREQRCQGMLPLVLPVCCDHCSCHPMLLGTSAIQTDLPAKQGTAVLLAWLLALVLKVSKARFQHKLDARQVLGGLRPPGVRMDVSSSVLRSVTARSKQTCVCCRHTREKWAAAGHLYKETSE